VLEERYKTQGLDYQWEKVRYPHPPSPSFEVSSFKQLRNMEDVCSTEKTPNVVKLPRNRIIRIT
jgi:hypothetical protein